MWISKRQYRGGWILAILIVLVAVGNRMVSQYYSGIFKNEASNASDSLLLDSLLTQIHNRQENAHTEYERVKKEQYAQSRIEKTQLPLQLHEFDPNTVSRADWMSMNLPERVFNGLEKYRAKGGKVRNSEAVRKLYNLDPSIAEQMVPFVKIDSSQFARSKFEFKKREPFPEKPKYIPFNINEADTTQLMSVYGIGRGIANRIVRHRTGLGGFISKEYIYDVFGIDSAVVDELFIKGILPPNPEIKKTNLNTITEEDLALNPYIRKGLARIIIKYRKQHGDFKKAEDLLEIKIIKADLVAKMKPYLDF